MAECREGTDLVGVQGCKYQSKFSKQVSPQTWHWGKPMRAFLIGQNGDRKGHLLPQTVIMVVVSITECQEGLSTPHPHQLALVLLCLFLGASSSFLFDPCHSAIFW